MGDPLAIPVETAKRLIQYWQAKFRILKDWQIEFDPDSEFKAQCDASPISQKATIFDLTTSFDEPCLKIPIVVQQSDYIRHEILHCCTEKLEYLAELKVGSGLHEADEFFVQDLCVLFESYDVDRDRKVGML